MINSEHYRLDLIILPNLAGLTPLAVEKKREHCFLKFVQYIKISTYAVIQKNFVLCFVFLGNKP